jgi:hypothetical protein
MSSKNQAYQELCKTAYNTIYPIVDLRIQSDITLFLLSLEDSSKNRYTPELKTGYKFDMGIWPTLPGDMQILLYHTYLGQGYHVEIYFNTCNHEYVLTVGDMDDMPALLASKNFSEIISKLQTAI